MSATSRHTQPSAYTAVPTTIKSTDSPGTELSSDEENTSLTLDRESSSENAVGSLAPGHAPESSSETHSVHLQKRRRVTRACDECRRKKIKCDGKQPCTHCQVYSYECTYDKPSNRRRNPAPQYIEALENKLSRAETLLRRFMPDVDLNDPNLDPAVQQEFRMREQSRLKAAALKKEQPDSPSLEGQLQTMIETVGQLDLDERGEYDFHGISSGSVFFKRMKEHFRVLLGRDYQLLFLPRPPRPAGVVNLDSPRSASSSPWEPGTLPDVYDLPPKQRVLTLCAESLDNATCLLRIVHKPSFYDMLHSLYDKHSQTFGTEDNRNLALVYSVIALGCMYNAQDDKTDDVSPYKASIEEALKYYSSARILLQDITDCRDITSLQALLFMILFIQSISNLSTCYGFVGIAMRSALRMGLHRHLPHVHLNAIDTETRRRVFYICRQLDTYVSALLGFPLLLNDNDIDQPLPTPIDDEYITKEGIRTPPPGTPSFFEAFNAHVNLMALLAKVVKNVYPLKGIEAKMEGDASPYASYMISYAKIKDIEEELQKWNEQLPITWRPNSEGPDEVVRVRTLLRFGFAHVQMVLYRPFLHYISPRISAGKNINERAYACGAAGISVARNILHIGTEMRKQVSLVGPYWFTFFSEFFAIISLVFFVLENQDKPGSMEVLADAVAGKDMISGLARKSMVADRISGALETLFRQLPDNLKNVKARATPSKKRPASSQQTLPGESMGRQVRSRSASAKPSRPTKTGIRQQNVNFDNSQPVNPDYNLPFSNKLQYTSLGRVQAGSPESLASSSLHEQPQLTLQQHGTSSANQLHRLDAMMFPSDDPLAYPNQPRVDLGSHRPGIPHTSTGGIQSHDPSQYYLPNHYDGIEGQLLGPLPPYLMQTQAQTHPGFDFPAQMYSDPMLSSQHIPLSQHRYHQDPQQHEHQHHPQHEAHQGCSHQQTGDYDDVVNNTQWHGMFPQQ